MKSFLQYSVAFISLFLSYNSGWSQSCTNQRYRDSIFAVEKHADIIFANVQSLTAVYVSENVTVSRDLKMDIWEPLDDTLEKRPCIIMAFGGGFLIGGKEDEDIQAYCDTFAHKGYVTASIEYRLGMNIASPPSSVRAFYRGAQDYSAAIRFLKENAEQYGIDTNYIFAGGASAGSISALQLAYLEEDERPVATYASGGITPEPDLGCKDCSGNIYQHGSKPKALINCWGAILDTAWIEAEQNVPIASFHGEADPIVPFSVGYPFTALFLMDEMYGSLPITERCNNVGIYNYFHAFAGQGHNVWGTVVANSFVGGPTPYFDTIITETRDFLYPFLQPALPVITGSSTVCMGDTVIYSVQQNPGSLYCWEVQGGTILSTNLQQNTIQIVWDNVGTGSVKAHEINHLLAVSDEALLSIIVSDCVTGINTTADNCTFIIFPNPIKSGAELQIVLPAANKTTVRISDMTGRTLIQKAGTKSLPISNELPSGVYILTISTTDGFNKSTKLIIE